MMEYDIHTVLDLLTLVATGVVVACMTVANMRMTYQKDQDQVPWWAVVRG
jgi:ER lumen protein retaining receptor